jgi:3-oxoacyl-[acyl-carrier-protein] synthase-3
VVEATVARLLEPGATMDDYKAYLPTLTLGSGAVALLLSHQDLSRTSHRLKGVVARAATQHSRICIGHWGEMRTDASKLLAEGVGLAHETWRLFGETFGVGDAEVAQYICHQVGAGHLATLMKRLELTLGKALPTYPEYGNMGSIALPFTLALAERLGRLRTGDHVALLGIGSGLNCSMAHVVW